MGIEWPSHVTQLFLWSNTKPYGNTSQQSIILHCDVGLSNRRTIKFIILCVLQNCGKEICSTWRTPSEIYIPWVVINSWGWPILGWISLGMDRQLIWGLWYYLSRIDQGSGGEYCWHWYLLGIQTLQVSSQGLDLLSFLYFDELDKSHWDNNLLLIHCVAPLAEYRRRWDPALSDSRILFHAQS